MVVPPRRERFARVTAILAVNGHGRGARATPALPLITNPPDTYHYFLSSAGQLTITVIGSGLASPAGTSTRKRWPSGETT